MSVRFDNRDYVSAHAKEPKGFGCWAFTFENERGEEETVFVPFAMTFREAKAWMNKVVRRRGFQDATVYVAS